MRAFPLLAALIPLLCALAPAAGLGAVYFWKDEQGVVHMTDRKPAGASPNMEVIRLPGDKTQDKPVVNVGVRASRVEAMQRAAAANPKVAEIAGIARDYNKSHTYSMADYFVCIDMALDMVNIFKTKGFEAKVVAGTAKADLAATPKDKYKTLIDHAWVVVELAKGLYVPVETTAGVVVTERVPHSEYYYQGLVFENPRQAKETDTLIRSSKEICQDAVSMANSYNQTYAGRPVSPQGSESKGRTEAKIKECEGIHKKYDGLIAAIYRELY